MELEEYHCQKCDKLLCKGYLINKEDVLEVKCRNCHDICYFSGKDAEIISKRSILIKDGFIIDTD